MSSGHLSKALCLPFSQEPVESPEEGVVVMAPDSIASLICPVVQSLSCPVAVQSLSCQAQHRPLTLHQPPLLKPFLSPSGLPLLMFCLTLSQLTLSGLPLPMS